MRRAALNSHGRATIHGLLLANVTRRARSAVAHARPFCPLAPARHRRFANVPPGVPFASPAREWTPRLARLSPCQSIRPRGSKVWRAGDGGGNWFAGIAGGMVQADSFRCYACAASHRNCPHARGGNLHGRPTPCRQAPRATLGRMESGQTASRWRDCAGGIVRDRFNLALRTAGMMDANPQVAQVPLYSMPPPCRIPLAREPSAMAVPPAPRATRARWPGSSNITATCATCGCGAVTRTAFRRPRRHATARCVAVIAPACRHPARQPPAAAVHIFARGRIGLTRRFFGNKLPHQAALAAVCPDSKCEHILQNTSRAGNRSRV